MISIGGNWSLPQATPSLAAVSSYLEAAGPPFEVHPRVARWSQNARKRRRVLIALLVLLAHLAGGLTSIRAIREVRTARLSAPVQ